MRQDTRRGTRTVVFATVVLASTAFIGWIIWQGDTITVRQIAWGLLGIVGISALGYVAENVTQRVKLKLSATGAEAEIGAESKPGRG